MRYRFAEFTLDADTETLSGPDGPLTLRRRTFQLLRTLVEHAPSLVTRDQIVDAVWGHDALSPNVLPQAVSEVRQALGDSAQAPRLIETRHRRGYRLLVPVERIQSPAAGTDVGMSAAATGPTSGMTIDREPEPVIAHVRARTDDMPKPRRVIVALLVAAAAIVAVGLVWNLQPVGMNDAGDAPRPSLAIVTQGTGDSPPWLPDAGVELLTVAMATDDRLHLARSDGRGKPDGIGDDRWQLWLREVLGVDYALTGTWRTNGPTLTLDYSLVRLSDGRVAHADRASGEDLAELSATVARDIRRGLRIVDPGTAWLSDLPGDDTARAAYYRGLSALAQGEAGAAIASLEQAMADSRAGTRVHLALASAYRRSGRLVQAREQFAKVLGAEREGLSVGERLRFEAEAAMVDDRPADAAASLRALHRLVPDDAEIALALADAQIRARQAKAAATTLAALETIAAGPVEDPRWHLAQSRLAALRNDAAGRRGSAETALRLAEQFGRATIAVDAAIELAQTSRAQGDMAGARARLEQLLEGELAVTQRADVQAQLGSLLRDMGEFGLAETLLNQARDTYEQRGDRAGDLRMRIELHIIQSERGHSEAAYGELVAMEPDVAALDDAMLLARYFNTLGVQAVRNDRVDDADRYLQRAASESRRAQQPAQEAGAYTNLGQVLARNKRHAEAEDVWEKALVVFRDSGDRMGEAITLSNLGALANVQGHLDRSRDFGRQALVLLRDLKASQHLARTAFNVGLLAEREGELQEASDLFEESLATYRAGEGGDPVIHAAAALARTLIALGDPARARATLESLEADAAAMTNPLAKSHYETAWGQTASSAGDLVAARRHHGAARALRKEAGLEDWAWMSDLDLLLIDLQERRPAEPTRATAERIAERLATAGDHRGELQARVVEATALIRLDRGEQALAVIEHAKTLLEKNGHAGLGREFDRLRILAGDDPPATREARLTALAFEAADAGFRTLALRCRLDASASDGTSEAPESAAPLRSEIEALGLAGLLTPLP
jgi:DNA-binding winged helix-turn-helix (wHTH) protein/tetratricopeptide (TPR) repeat protein